MHLTQESTLQNGKYRIIRVLGQGGFGITYLATHTMLDKLVAVKEFFPKEYCNRDGSTSHITVATENNVELVKLLKKRFITEAKNVSRLNHRNIITIHDIFEENATAYYIMDFIAGYSLHEIIKRDGPIEERKAIEYIKGVADAVEHMHALHMNHLDIKPANVMLKYHGDEPVLIDFGLSKQYSAAGGNTTTTPVGISHGYAPGEQYRPGGLENFTPQTDVYALGATLYALLTGKTPPHFSEIVENGLPQMPGNISTNTRKAVMHAMQVSKAKRPSSVKEFIEELETKPKLNEPVTRGSAPARHLVPEQEVQSPNMQRIPQPAEIELGVKRKEPKMSVTRQPYSNETEGIRFVDLGLSVLWAETNYGAATPADPGTPVNRDNVQDSEAIERFGNNGIYIPSIRQWRELIENCSMEWTRLNGKAGFRVSGRNGNSIFLPVFSGLFGVFGRLYTKESFEKNFEDYTSNLFLYFSPNEGCKISPQNVSSPQPARFIKQK